MVDEDTLATVLGDFARTMVTDFPTQGILDHLVRRVVSILPVSGAGAILIASGKVPHYIAASDDAALRLERLQFELGDGPHRTAARTGEPVIIPDLAADSCYPRSGAAALAAGVAALFTFPLRHGDAYVGALDLYRETTGGLDARAIATAQTLADVAAAYLVNSQAREQALSISEQFRNSSLHDSLTGLPNRALLQERLEHAAKRARRSRSTSAILFTDIDHFKKVNDSHGHAMGDTLLIAVAERLTTLVRPGDTLARVGGDEFVFLCEDVAQVDDIELIADRVNKAFDEPFDLNGVALSVTASVGIAYAGPGEIIGNQLVADADTAMYQAKRAGGAAHKIIDLRAADLSGDRDRMQEDLHAAVSTGGLELVYQPIVRTVDAAVIGVEALLRWNHPARGPVPALTVVSVAERNGFIAALGTWVLEQACRDRMRWLSDHPDRPLELSVNVSARQLMGPGFVDCLTQVIDATGMPASALVLEVTESIFLEEWRRLVGVLAEIRGLGVRVALDDFGTGYGSLGFLRHSPVEIVKIDRSFVADIGRDPAATAIVDAVCNLAHVLDMSVTAEGVETGGQRDALVSMGCEQAQGYLYARPMTGHAVAGHLATSLAGPLRLPLDQPGATPEAVV